MWRQTLYQIEPSLSATPSESCEPTMRDKPVYLAAIPRIGGPARTAHSHEADQSKNPVPNPFYRCAGPNCGILKQSSDRWWLMWTSSEHFDQPALYLCAWDEDIENAPGVDQAHTKAEPASAAPSGPPSPH